jgi:hypothetical protein
MGALDTEGGMTPRAPMPGTAVRGNGLEAQRRAAIRWWREARKWRETAREWERLYHRDCARKGR